MTGLIKTTLILTVIAALGGCGTEDVKYDLVIAGGRVIDPETKLDAVRNVGINNNTIAAVTTDSITGHKTIDASGQVVSPGFIDQHAHGQNIYGQTYQVQDGVTSAMDLEGGIAETGKHLATRAGKSLIHYGYSSGWMGERIIANGGASDFFRDDADVSNRHPLDGEKLEHLFTLVEQDLDEGAIGIGIPLAYVPGTSDEELKRLFALAADRNVAVFIHIRGPVDGGDSLTEIIDLSRETGASVQIVHVVSSAYTDKEHTYLTQYLDLISKAQEEGLDITTEIHPYPSNSTGINAAFFPDNWDPEPPVYFKDIEWPPTGERFTGKKMWEEYRKKYPDGIIILHFMQEAWVEEALKHPGVMVASDGMPLKSLTYRVHPRGTGTYARVLGRFVREKGTLTLPDAIARMTYLPAKRLEGFTPVMKHKGRIQVGADADITVFDPKTVIDRATYENPHLPSEGINHVVVDGQIVVENGTLKDGVYPGKPISTLAE